MSPSSAVAEKQVASYDLRVNGADIDAKLTRTGSARSRSSTACRSRTAST